jgi:sugar O-acyltransferase (sialic acid O-acetyltransferase NeuD family)
MSRIVLFGNGRGADVAFRYLTQDSDHEVCGFTVDRKYMRGQTFRNLPVVPFEEVEHEFPPDTYRMFVLLGYQEMNALRERKYLEAKSKGYEFISYICSDFFRPTDLEVGENCFILDNQSICFDVKIGNNVVMWSSNHIGDLSVIRDHAWISSHVTIAANVTVSENCFLGVGATVSGRVKLGKSSFVGAHALISSNTNPNSVHICPETPPAGVESRAFMRILAASGKL